MSLYLYYCLLYKLQINYRIISYNIKLIITVTTLIFNITVIILSEFFQIQKYKRLNEINFRYFSYQDIKYTMNYHQTGDGVIVTFCCCYICPCVFIYLFLYFIALVFAFMIFSFRSVQMGVTLLLFITRIERSTNTNNIILCLLQQRRGRESTNTRQNIYQNGVRGNTKK